MACGRVAGNCDAALVEALGWPPYLPSNFPTVIHEREDQHSQLEKPFEAESPEVKATANRIPCPIANTTRKKLSLAVSVSDSGANGLIGNVARAIKYDLHG